MVRGEGFASGESLKLLWSRVVGNRMTGRGWEEAADVIAESKADAAGRVEFGFKVPTSAARILSPSSRRAARKTGTFWIKPTALPLDIARGPVGVPYTPQGGRLERDSQHRTWSTTTATSATPASTARAILS
jgi:hypothetical protein